MMAARSLKNHLATMILPMLFSLLKNMMARSFNNHLSPSFCI